MFSRAMSDMYRAEVPQYGTLLKLVEEVNLAVRKANPALDGVLRRDGEIERLDLERHGAIRLGTAEELATIRRLFAVLGMVAVGYYDLSVAGVPVHSTAFRPVDAEALRINPFRVFTSLLRLDLVADQELRAEAAEILAKRTIFTPGCLELIEMAERHGGLTAQQGARFVSEALETFRWQSEATVSADVYRRLMVAHPLVADVVCFNGPHINHLTPRTLDIDAIQNMMPARGIVPKAVIEGPPPRKVPIFLRQTSFKALHEPIVLKAADGNMSCDSIHAARFGEVEERGIAVTTKGRALYDKLLGEVRRDVQVKGDGSNAEEYMAALSSCFQSFPDDVDTLRKEGLAFFRYAPTDQVGRIETDDLEALLELGFVKAEPIIYEDFLPVSAAGIFQSNLGDGSQQNFVSHANLTAFEQALGAKVADEVALYAEAELSSKKMTLAALNDRSVV
ncbi:MAG: VOC family protein [Pseudomonadota bacterium]